MTDTTDNARGPERIWANVAVWGNGEPLAGEWTYRDVGLTDDIEYIRADLAPDPLSDPRVTALVEVLIRIEDLTQHNMGMSAQDERCVNREARAALAAFEGGRDD